jgi:hypothetical protein
MVKTMTSSYIEDEQYLSSSRHYAQENIDKLGQPAIETFKGIIKKYTRFQLSFIMLFAIECLVLLLFFTFLAKTSLLATGIALTVLTFFSYIIAKAYINSKKPHQFSALKDELINASKKILNYQEGRSDHHLAIAKASCDFGAALKDCEYNLWKTPEKLASFSNAIQKISCWIHSKDVHIMREFLFNAAIDEHIKFIKFEPTNLEAHASLANTYVLLSGLYSDPRKSQDFDEDLFIPLFKYSEEMKKKFVLSAERAMEEFKILNDYAPNDPWVHRQLAYSYHDLQMPLEEIKEYETILKICPGDNETLFNLGVLYFEQGFNAKGLQVYEELKRVHYKKAEDLISFYGSYNPES